MNTSKRHVIFRALMLLGFLQISSTPTLASDWLYSMKPGDTLWTVCQQYAKEPGCWQKLGPLNKINRNRAIPPGTRIRIPASWLKVPPASATIVFYQGDARYQLLGETESPASKGVKLPVGAKLITGKGTLTLAFADGSSMVLEANSQLELDALSSFELNGMVDSTVRLKQGTVKTRVIKREPRSQFRTLTPSAVASVRGTEYRVNVVPADNLAATDNVVTSNNIAQPTEAKPNDASQSEQHTTLVEVYQGLVDVGADSTHFPVPASFGIVAKKGEALEAPVRLLEQPVYLDSPMEHQLITEFSTGAERPDFTSSPLSIEWHAMEKAAGFQLNILNEQDDAEQLESLIQSYRVNDTKVNISDLALGCYQLSLRAIDKLGLHGMAAKKPLCLTRKLATPALQQTKIDDSKGNHLKLHWNEVSQASHYQVEVSEMADFSSLLQQAETHQPSYQIAHEKALFVRVQAIGQDGLRSEYSPVWEWHPEVKKEQPYWPIFVQIGIFILAIL